MRKHGRIRNWLSGEIEQAMWAARTLREARKGARIVAGPDGEVLRVDAVLCGGYDVVMTELPVKISPDIYRRVGKRWVEADLKRSPA